jgi:hypothetical protein
MTTHDAANPMLDVLRVTGKGHNMSPLQPEQVRSSRSHGLGAPLRLWDATRAAIRTTGRLAEAQANEAAMLISAVMMTPLRLAGGGCDGPGKAMSYTPVGTSVQQLAERLVAEVEQLSSRTGVRTRFIWSDTAWAVSSSHRRSPTVVWPSGWTR